MKPFAAMDADSRDALILTSGRSLGFAVAFAIPLVLVRVLDQEAFGTYKYLFLISATLTVLQLGAAESLYYFVPRAQREAGRVVANAVLVLAGVAGLLIAVGALGTEHFAGAVGAAGLTPYFPHLSWYLAGILISMPLEIVMVSRRQVRTAALTYAVSDICRATLLVVPALMAPGLAAVLAGAAAFGVFRMVVTAGYLWRTFGINLRPDRVWARAQLAYALPFAIAVVIETVQINMHQFVVWRRFDPSTFAVYAAGCLQVPMVDLLATSVGNMMMVRMADGAVSNSATLVLWHQAVTRLSRVLLPLVVALLLTAHDLITVLFTSAYEASVPIFMVSTVTIALATLPVDSILRAWAQTRFLIVMNLVRLAVVVAGISWAIGALGLTGAMLITVSGLVAAKTVALWRIARTLNAGPAAILPWRALATTGVLACLAALPVLLVHPLLPPTPLMRAGIGTTLYVLAFVGLSAGLHSISNRHRPLPSWAPGEERL